MEGTGVKSDTLLGSRIDPGINSVQGFDFGTDTPAADHIGITKVMRQELSSPVNG
jgi:hypothetical protein